MEDLDPSYACFVVVQAKRGELAPETDGTIPAVLAGSVMGDPAGTYLVDGADEYTFADVAERADRARSALRGLGISSGDRIVLWLPNGLPWVVSFFAALQLGATVVPVGTRLRAADLRHVLSDSRARALVFAPSFLGIDFDRMVAELQRMKVAGELEYPEHLLAVGDGAISAAHVLEELEPRAEPSDASPPGPDAPAMVCYSSGTTGRPKGCVHTHRALVRNATIAAGLTGLEKGERIVCPVPFAHVFGFHMGVLQAAVSGSTLINAEPFNPERYLDLCESHGATVAYAVPTMAREVVVAQARTPRRLSVRLALVAGAPVSAGLRRGITGKDGLAAGVSVAYGCTEAPTISQLLPHAASPQRERSVGRPTPGVEVRIAKPGTVEELAIDETGEILVRGYNTMSGYLDDAEATARKFRQGWLVTGDLGSLDENGYLQFTSRADDTILVGGFNAYPREIEALLEELEGVEEAAVVGVPDDRLGQVPMAWVVVDPALLDERKIVDWSRDQMASYKRPRYVEVVDRLPRVVSGKVARLHLMDQARRLLPTLPWEEASE